MAESIVFAMVTVHTVRAWRRHRSAATAWLAATFVLITAVTATAFLPQVTGHRSVLQELYVRAVVTALLLIPKGLYRFTEGFRPSSRPVAIGVAAATVLVIAPLTVGPSLPGPEAPRPAWLAVWTALVVSYWTWLTVLAARRLWREGRDKPTLARRRMSTLAAGALVINLGILLSVAPTSRNPGVVLAVQVVSFVSALVFFGGYVVPHALRTRWRRPEMLALREAEAGLMRATTREALAAAILPHAAAVLGGGRTLLVDDAGNVFGDDDVETRRRQMEAARSAAGTPGSVVEPSERIVVLRLHRAALVIETLAAAPFFGRDDLELLERLGWLIDLALARADVYDELEATCVDLTERERQLAEAQEIASIGSYEWDPATGTTTWSEEMVHLLDATPEEAGDMAAFLERVHPDDRALVVQARGESEASGSFEMDYRIVRRDGELRWIRGSGHRVSRDDGSSRVVGVLQDITDKKRTEDLLSHQALHDPLTDLPNRLLLMDRLEQSLARRRWGSARPAVLFVDIDRFKSVNDAFGHAGGDDVLKTVAKRLLELVQPGETVARIGGDEFVVLVDDVRHDVTAVALADRIRAAIAKPMAVGARSVSITCSVGVAIDETGAPDGEALVRDADLAMYRAKELGRARSELFDTALRSSTVDRLELEVQLRAALEQDELELHFQPSVALATGEVTDVEALIRWRHPERGTLLPSEFIPLAEESGLIVAIGAWALRQVCELASDLRRQLGERTPTVWLNVSAHQLRGGSLRALVEAALRDTGYPADGLGLEITESALMSDADAAADELEHVRALGVHLALDDFGTGFSSLSSLRRFPFDLLKIDRSFVAGLGVDAEDSAIVSACVALAHSLGMSCVAEGVESQEQIDALRLLGCDHVQGYFFSHAVAMRDLARVIEHLRVTGGGAAGSSAGPLRVLVCDDDASVRLLLRVGLEAEGVEVVEVADAEECVATVARAEPDLVLLDVRMPGRGGMWALEQIHGNAPDLPVLLVTAASSRSLEDHGHRLGARGCVDKVGILDHLSEVLAVATTPRAAA